MNRYERHLKVNPQAKPVRRFEPGAVVYGTDLQPGDKFKLQPRAYEHEVWECVRRGPHKRFEDVAHVRSEERGRCPYASADDIEGLWIIPAGDQVVML